MLKSLPGDHRSDLLAGFLGRFVAVRGVIITQLGRMVSSVGRSVPSLSNMVSLVGFAVALVSDAIAAISETVRWFDVAGHQGLLVVQQHHL